MNSDTKSISRASANTTGPTTSEVLYAAAEHIRKHGFTYEYQSESTCAACMVGAIAAQGQASLSYDFLEVMGLDWEDVKAYTLRRNGWTKSDAIAALEIAADIAYAEGK